MSTNPTSESISVSDPVESTIDYPGDVDTYDIYLPGVKSYGFDLTATGDGPGGSFYPTLAIYDGNRTRVAFDDNSGDSADVHIDYEAESGGYYTLEVAGRDGTTGSYRLTSAEV